MGYSCKIIADSVSRAGDRLTTMEVTFPRIILAEFNTHRVFSRNSASSRAIPLATQLERITQDPFVPEYWGKLQAGMQANEVVDDTAAFRAQVEWMDACSEAVAFAGRLNKLGIHKQLTNRLLEPFMWHTVIVTATEWSNFFALRNNSMAQPEIHTIAAMMQEAYDSGEPDFVDSGKWHLPLIQPDELGGDIEMLKKISAGRCARVSYLTHGGVRDQVRMSSYTGDSLVADTCRRSNTWRRRHATRRAAVKQMSLNGNRPDSSATSAAGSSCASSYRTRMTSRKPDEKGVNWFRARRMLL